MCNCTGSVVESLAGNDKGGLLYVLAQEGQYLLLADGKRRKLASPKRKKSRHVAVLGTPRFGEQSTQNGGEPVSNQELRRALAAFRTEFIDNQGGK